MAGVQAVAPSVSERRAGAQGSSLVGKYIKVKWSLGMDGVCVLVWHQMMWFLSGEHQWLSRLCGQQDFPDGCACARLIGVFFSAKVRSTEKRFPMKYNIRLMRQVSSPYVQVLM